MQVKIRIIMKTRLEVHIPVNSYLLFVIISSESANNDNSCQAC